MNPEAKEIQKNDSLLIDVRPLSQEKTAFSRSKILHRKVA
jgi:hypothetical protein